MPRQPKMGSAPKQPALAVKPPVIKPAKLGVSKPMADILDSVQVRKPQNEPIEDPMQVRQRNKNLANSTKVGKGYGN